ncbi:hypothetical protein RISK_001810 [Rhodopirellula islandica]|uniref:Uncharacterized protein n=1 Tax=Rhodopirellula islandica TaxID=595434 RepID=A0A0J1EKB9_RHOIS|nr:DUF2947 family protein [Rhodopirellula islandica]KLU05959.1 hypothetical protein RISK_001810 [Rhodopirellula islandica]
MAFTEIPGCFHNDPPIADADQREINVLGKSDATTRWDHLVSASDRHFMLLDQTEWPVQLVRDASIFFTWMDDWNNDAADAFCDALRTLDISPAETITIFWMREHAVESSWDAFTRNWINFLYEDEGCIVVPTVSHTSLVLSNGYSWVGTRPSAA